MIWNDVNDYYVNWKYIYLYVVYF